MTERPKIYFLGSGDIAVPVLKSLAEAPEVELLGVGTQLDRPAGRKRQLTPTPVGAYAASKGMPVDKIASVNAPEFLDKMRALAPDIILVVSFGQLLKEEILRLPRVGCVNIHASLLPRYRGASPIVQCILNRDSETGVAFMLMDKGLDTGPVYQMLRIPLDHREYADALEFKMGLIAGREAPGILCAIARGELEAVPQDSGFATCCTKIRKSDGNIDWSCSFEAIDARGRAYTPWPGAKCRLLTSKGETVVALTKVKKRPALSGKPGQVLQADKYGLIIGCGKAAIEVVELAPPGRHAMPAAAFLNGLRGEKPIILP